MGDGQLRRRRRKNSRRRAALAVKREDVPDELFELVFLRLTLPADLVRAACTCKRWRRIIAADDGYLIRSIHGEPSSHVVGRYTVTSTWPSTWPYNQRYYGSRPPGRHPTFFLSKRTLRSSPWAGILASRNLALDFLPPPELGHCWELADIRDGLLLLLLFSWMSDRSLASPSRLVVCDPVARRHREIQLPAWFCGHSCLGAFFRDGGGEPITLSNFRLTFALYRDGIVKGCAFSSATRTRWAPGADNNCWAGKGGEIRFAGCRGSVAYWTIGGARIVLALDKEAAELSSFLAPGLQYTKLRNKVVHSPEYAYKLAWPPSIRSCVY